MRYYRNSRNSGSTWGYSGITDHIHLRTLKRTSPQGAVERYLEVSIECCLDIGEMIISWERARKPETYREVIEILGEIGVLPGDFADKFAPAAGFRNILVHMYAEIDVERVYLYLQRDLEDIEKFAVFVARYLEELSD